MSSWTLDRAQRQIDDRLDAIAASIGAVRMVLGRDGDQWHCWATFTPNDGPPTLSDTMTLVGEGEWLSDVLDAAEVWARNLLARARAAN